MERREDRRKRRHLRVRKRVFGTAERPRLNVFRSSKHMYAQLIIDETGNTVAAASTLDPELRDALKGATKVEAARRVGELIGRRALAKGFTKAVFDRGGYMYHGRVAAVAEGARSAGLDF